jgi:glycosyltransferase involved in cell wall biosynthesis
MSAPLISVVMPVYNGERFVVEAVRSILAQTCRDFECIVVDDGSTDKTAELLAAEQAADARLVVHRQPSNMGFRTALNTGCALARGELVARMDADDVSLPTRLERQVGFLQANPTVGVVGSAVQLIDAQGVRGRVKSFPLTGGLVAWSMLFFNSLAHPSVMLRRRVLEAAGFYPAGCAGGTEDYALFLEISRTWRLANLDDVLLLYRVWGGNMTKTAWDVQERDAIRLILQFLATRFDVVLTADEATALRGLSRDQYPGDPREAARLGSLIERLVPVYVEHFSADAADAQAIRHDAGIRLWLLSALALRRGSPASLSLAAKAFATSPSSLGSFVAKAARRLTERSRR